ncbi:MAG TPA: cytochrome P450 [Nocardioidaceae bacterium]|nr:cytochrome P450 [Nocardioidaceae bacterium]
MTLRDSPVTDPRRGVEERLTKMRPQGRGVVPQVRRDQVPPGSRLPYPIQTFLFFRYRHRFIPWLHRRYGDAFTVRMAPASRTLVLLRRPEDIKAVFGGDPHEFYAGLGNGILGPVMGEHSLLLTDGDEHARARKLLMPAFNGAALRGYQGLVREIAGAEVESWSDGQTARSLDRMNAVTLEIILRVVFGVTDEARLARLRPRVNRTVDIRPWMLLGWIYPQIQRIRPWRAFTDNMIELDRLLYSEIAERRKASDLGDRDDVLSRLLHVGDEAGDTPPLTDPELRDQLVTLLLAGHETTASALSWSLHEIGRDPALQRRAHDAVDAGDDSYLEAIVKEAMRLHPIIPIVNRALMAPQRIAGWDLPAGAIVAPSIILAHANAESFPEPDRFRPDRFLDDHVPANAWIPFGGGVRRCIGAGFSLMEGVAVLREVLSRWRVESSGVEKPRTRNITSVPAGGAPITVRRR